MKSKIKILCALFCMIVAVSCKKQNLPPKPEPSPFNAVLQNPATIPSDGGTALIDIKAGSDGWWVVIPENAKTWCSSSQLFGSGDKTIKITFSKNNSGVSRSVILQVNPTFGLPPESFNFQQD